MESTGKVENVRRARIRNDRILPETRWVSAIIVPFLVAAFAILYLFPDHTHALFAWGIQPRMSAMMLGAAYVFVRASANASWDWVKVGFRPVTTFAPLLGLATVIRCVRCCL